MSVIIKEVQSTELPPELLLLADPSLEKINAYLADSYCFVVEAAGSYVGACVVQERRTECFELMNIAVQPSEHQQGYGTLLLQWMIEFFRQKGARQLEVGTGSFGYQLAFYQRQGFRVTGIDHDFFIHQYPEPIFENGIQHFDMLRLTLKFF